MAKLPINFSKIIITDPYNDGDLKYLITISDKSRSWDKTISCRRDELLKLKEELDNVLADTSTAEILGVSDEEAKIIDEAHKSDKLCVDCKYKMTYDCVTCLFKLDSPLERKLFLELKKAYIKFIPQYGLNWRGKEISVAGKTFDDPVNNFKEVLTIVDFYIEKGKNKLCVYTDGHTYHERTEEQALHDKNIDRKLQEFGYKVLHYTGKEVNENSGKIIDELKKWN